MKAKNYSDEQTIGALQRIRAAPGQCGLVLDRGVRVTRPSRADSRRFGQRVRFRVRRPARSGSPMRGNPSAWSWLFSHVPAPRKTWPGTDGPRRSLHALAWCRKALSYARRSASRKSWYLSLSRSFVG